MQLSSLVSCRLFVLHLNLLWFLCAYYHFRECHSFLTSAKHKYSNRIVHTKYGPLQGVFIQNLHVEAFLGVPYATPPLESLRFMPPVTPSLWTKTKMADTFSPVCPQKLPDISNRTEALLQIPRGRLVYLEKLLPLLANQSEDCLYLNIYVPKNIISRNNIGLIPTILYIHGESYEWNAGNPYDGSVLASYGNIIVVTINYRLGILGFLKTGNSNSTQGNYGLMDIIAGLHWLRENLSSFGGDPDRITVMGHTTGAALANFIAASPVTRELLHRVILISGSGLSPWAIQRDPLAIKRKVSEQTSCHGDLLQDDIAPCLRLKKLSELLKVQIDPPRFLPGFAPFVDGSVLQHGVTDSIILPDILSLARNKRGRGYELSDFPDRDLVFGVTSLESYTDFCAQDLEFGFAEAKRDRVLRTFVRNCYYFHLNEIFSTLKNEYTDWERSAQSPISIRDSTLDVLSDGHTVSYLLKIGYLHSIRGGRTFFFHFTQPLNEKEFPQKFGSIRGDDVPFIMGFPLLGTSQFLAKNFSDDDVQLCKQIIRYISNFARKGDPNNGYSDSDKDTITHWDAYDSVNQLYLEIERNTLEVRKIFRRRLYSNLFLRMILLNRSSDVAVTLLLCSIIHAKPVERLNLIKGFPNIDEFYLRVRERDKETVTRPLEKDLERDIKSRIYYNIFRCKFFEKMGLEVVGTSERSNGSSMTQYPHSVLEVRTSKEEMTEYGFPVFVEDTLIGGGAVKFFLSEEYNVNIDYEPYSAGRFIFLENDFEGGSLQVFGLVEEPARVIEDSPQRLEELYLESRNEAQSTAEKIKKNHLLLLNNGQRNQVCSSVVNSPFFDDKIENYLEENLRFYYDSSWTVEFNHQTEDKTVHEESAIVCPVKLKPVEGGKEEEKREGEGLRGGDEETRETAIYLVTRGNAADNVFVYTHKSGRKISLLNLSSHIRNVYEWELPVDTRTEDTMNIDQQKRFLSSH